VSTQTAQIPLFVLWFGVNLLSRKYQFWKRGALPVLLFIPGIIYQKLNIQNNPCQKKWMLSPDPISYVFSSASFYEDGVDHFGFLTYISDRQMK
jgi:hypothetical protein